MKIAIIGGGQVGVSAGLGIYWAAGGSNNIHFYDINPDCVEQLNEIVWESKASAEISVAGDFDEFCDSSIHDADLVVLATPIDQFGPVAKKIALHLKEGAVLTTTGSVAAPSHEAVAQELAKAGRSDVHFFWSHPGTGNEKSGPMSAKPDMYDGATVFIQKLDEDASPAAREAHATLVNFWEKQGAETKLLGAKTHDLFLGITSHLTHFGVAFPLARMGNTLAGLYDSYRHGGSALCNTTRIATANPAMWLPIAEGNREAICKGMSGLEGQMESLAELIKLGKRDELEARLSEARDFRATLAPKDEKNGVPRENIFGELADCLGKTVNNPAPGEAANLLRINSKEEAFALVAGLPYLVAVAAALNAKEFLGKEPDIDLPKMVNPSFLDATAPALNDPSYMANLLMGINNALFSRLPNSGGLGPVGLYACLLPLIREDIRDGDKGNLECLIKTAGVTREQMPPPRRAQVGKGTEANRAIRPEYLIEKGATKPLFVPHAGTGRVPALGCGSSA